MTPVQTLRVTVALVLLSSAACSVPQGTDAPDPAIAAVVSQHLDSLNGLPTVVVNGFWCDPDVERCIPNAEGPPMSPLDATEFAAAFAAARDIPLVQPTGFRAPPCPWAVESGEAGLYASFPRPPLVIGDSARVELSTGCSDDGAAFEQVHQFLLRRALTGWVVLRRELTSIT